MRRDCWDTEKKLREDINTSLVRELNVGDDGVLVPVQPPSFRSRDDLGVRKLHVANPRAKHVLTYRTPIIGCAKARSHVHRMHVLGYAKQIRFFPFSPERAYQFLRRNI